MSTKARKNAFAILMLTLTAAGCTSVPTKTEDFVPETALYLSETLKVGSFYTLAPGYYVQIGEREDQKFFESTPEVDLTLKGPRGFVTKAILVDPHQALMIKPGKICIVTVFNVSVCDPISLGEGEVAELRPIPK